MLTGVVLGRLPIPAEFARDAVGGRGLGDHGHGLSPRAQACALPAHFDPDLDGARSPRR